MTPSPNNKIHCKIPFLLIIPSKKNIVEASSSKNTAVKKAPARAQTAKSNTKVNDSVELAGDPNGKI